jgi:hypothetical protein
MYMTARTEEHVDGGYAGTITLESGDEVGGDLAFDADRVVLRVAGSTVGDWSVGEFEVDRSDDGVYSLEVEGEVLAFLPEDESGFAAALEEAVSHPEADILPIGGAEPAVEAEPDPVVEPEPVVESEETTDIPDADEIDDDMPSFGGGRVRLAAAVAALSSDRDDQSELPDEDDRDADIYTFTGLVGEDSVATQRELRSKIKTRRFPSIDLRSIARKTGIAVAIIAVVGVLAWTTPRILSSFSTEAAPTTTIADADPASSALPGTTGGTEAAPETTVTTEAADTVTTVAPPPPTAFDIPTPEFVSTWNDVGGDVAPALEFPSLLPTGAFESEFTPYLRASGVVGLDGELESLTLTVDPLGPTGSDALALQALGVMIAVVDPSIEPEQRASLLAALGLDVRNPQLGGIDGELETNGVRYRLFYDSEAVLLTFTADPTV